MACLSSHKSGRGATIIEFCLVLSLVLFLIVGFIDVARYLGTRAVMLHGAQSGLNLAQKISDLDIDFNQVASTSPEYARFLTARNRVEAVALAMPSTTFIPCSDGAVGSLSKIEFRDFLTDGEVFPRTESCVLLLRPGDAAIRLADGTQQNHPTLCRFGAGCLTGDRVPGDSWEKLLRQHPIVVELRTELHPFLGGTLVTLPIRVSASGYREFPG